MSTQLGEEWETECRRWWGRVLVGKHVHWCREWDGLPLDETCGAEWECCTCIPRDQR